MAKIKFKVRDCGALEGWKLWIKSRETGEWKRLTYHVNGGPMSGFNFDTEKQAISYAKRWTKGRSEYLWA
jgi:hypothetical protein